MKPELYERRTVETVESPWHIIEAFLFSFQLKLLKRRKAVSQRRLVPNEVKFLKESLSADYKTGNIRLREGEYQYDLAKAIAAFQLELYFPDVKDIIKKLYGEEKNNDIQFIRKIQTILKKMEKSGIVTILPKKKPWDLQRYALLSFKFRDADKNLVIFATEQEVKQAQGLLQYSINHQTTPTARILNAKAKAVGLVLLILASYAAILWDFMQPIVSPLIFIPAFAVAVVCSIVLGKIIS